MGEFVRSMMPMLVTVSRGESNTAGDVAWARTWVALVTVGADIVAGHSLDELMQLLLVARLLALADGPGHGSEGRRHKATRAHGGEVCFELTIGTAGTTVRSAQGGRVSEGTPETCVPREKKGSKTCGCRTRVIRELRPAL